MLVKFKCKKCEKEGYFDVGDLDKLEAMKAIADQFSKGFTCSVGNHVEVDSIFNYYDIDWDNPVEHVPMTEEQFLNNLKNDFVEVYSTEELREKYNIDGFMGGYCLVSEKNDEDKQKMMLFFQSPEGKRYYVYGTKY